MSQGLKKIKSSDKFTHEELMDICEIKLDFNLSSISKKIKRTPSPGLMKFCRRSSSKLIESRNIPSPNRDKSEDAACLAVRQALKASVGLNFVKTPENNKKSELKSILDLRRPKCRTYPKHIKSPMHRRRTRQLELPGNQYEHLHLSRYSSIVNDTQNSQQNSSSLKSKVNHKKSKFRITTNINTQDLYSLKNYKSKGRRSRSD